ncbi:unnamed protein product [Allacma fusca]|uniref:Uncharacterized protein n=1 Tax=Allacma fusca TaxID=39272 RepID=A0A8J2JVK6_9HEXA|nr:unnamed protein product [Allacma fusca]
MTFIDYILSYFSSEEDTTDKSSAIRKKGSPYNKMPPGSAEFQHRDGHGGGGWGSQGWGGQNSVYSQSGQTSPAVSALALLGFLFFLNLIQSSLSLNRQLMTTTVITANASAGAGATAAGRVTKDESDATRGERQRRGVEELFKSFNKTNPEFLSAISSQPAHRMTTDIQDSSILTPRKRNNGRPILNQLENPIAALPEDSTVVQTEGTIADHMRIASLLSSSPWGWRRCVQLLMCNLGQRLQSSLGKESRTVLAIKLFGQQILSTLTPKSGWANQVARALMVGYRSRKDCGEIYKQCKLLPDDPDRKYNPILEAH